MSIQGVSIPVAQAEDLIIYKAVAWRERDRRDIRELVLRHRDSIDFEHVRLVIATFAEAMETPDRLAELDYLLREID